MKSLMRQGLLGILFLVGVGVWPAHAQESVESARKVLIKVSPVYPTLAKSMNIHGITKLEAVVEPNGIVKRVNVKGGHPLLTQSAVTAVERWKYEPAAHETKEQIEIQFDPQ